MSSHLIFWPLLMQAILPIIVLFINGKRKADDVKAEIADLEKAAMDNEAWSKPVVLTSKSLGNQFQFPVIFYVICLVLASINAVGVLTLVLAWAFVAARYLHAAVHVTSNYVPTRMRVFILGIIILLALIVATGVALLSI